MPKFLEKILKKEAAKKGLKGEDADRYTYGAMNNMGALRGSKITPKGEAMQEKHDEDIGKRKQKVRKTRVLAKKPYKGSLR